MPMTPREALEQLAGEAIRYGCATSENIEAREVLLRAIEPHSLLRDLTGGSAQHFEPEAYLKVFEEYEDAGEILPEFTPFVALAILVRETPDGQGNSGLIDASYGELHGIAKLIADLLRQVRWLRERPVQDLASAQIENRNSLTALRTARDQLRDLRVELEKRAEACRELAHPAIVDGRGSEWEAVELAYRRCLILLDKVRP